MSVRATGTFDVKIGPLELSGTAGMETLGRMSIDKQIHGDLEGTTKGEMLTAMSPVQGSAGYVAVERVSATLQGRAGSFVLQHSATMNRGVPHLVIVVVPDSGTGQLTGITGTFKIIIEGKQHSYTFDYTLPGS